MNSKDTAMGSTAAMPLLFAMQGPIVITPGLSSESIQAIIGIVVGTILVIAIGLPIIRAIIRGVERRSAPPALRGDLNQRLDRIEQTVDSIAVEVERVSEAQRFLTRLQTEDRPVGSGQQPPR